MAGLFTPTVHSENPVAIESTEIGSATSLGFCKDGGFFRRFGLESPSDVGVRASSRFGFFSEFNYHALIADEASKYPSTGTKTSRRPGRTLANLLDLRPNCRSSGTYGPRPEGLNQVTFASILVRLPQIHRMISYCSCRRRLFSTTNNVLEGGCAVLPAITFG
jgi:hypothetical protein